MGKFSGMLEPGRDPSVRERLPAEREGITHKFRIGEIKGYVTANCYEDGRLGEIFVRLDQQGSQVSGFVDSWSIAISMLLQTGTPIETICEKFKGCSFSPAGWTGNPDIPFAKSAVDYVARWLERTFVPEVSS